MPTTLTGSIAGDWWHRLGELEGMTLDFLSLLGGTATTNVASGAQVPTRLAAWVTDFLAGTADYATVTALQQAAASQQSSVLSLVQAMPNIVQQSLVYAANTISPLPLVTVTAAFQFLIEKMTAAGAQINYGTEAAVGAQTAATWVTPVGSPVFAWATENTGNTGLRDSAGRRLQYIYPETVTVTVTGDAQGSATAGQEPYSIVGQNAQTNSLSWDWLKGTLYGSGASISGNLVDPAVNNTATTATTGNLLVNGAILASTTSNQADNWTILTGAAGSTITVSTSGGYLTGTGAITMVSNGSTDLAVTQSFSTPSSTSVGLGGTPYALLPGPINNTQYLFHVAYKLSATASAGVLQIDLIDGAGNIITDEFGTANTATFDLTTLVDTNYHVLTCAFRMPKTLPASTPYKVRVWQSTAVQTGKNLILSCMALTVAQPFYPGGGYVAGFRGPVNPNASGTFQDAWTFGLTYTPGRLAKAIFRYFNPPSLGPATPGLMIPATTSSAASPADALVA